MSFAKWIIEIGTIHAVNITTLNLNLLVVFHALTTERSVSGAAKRVGLSQPGTSNALARLRSIFDDRLFYRSGQMLVPTAKAVALAGPVSEAIELIRKAINDAPQFDPAKANLRFRILATDYCEMAIIAPFVRTLRSVAPGIEIQVRRPTELFAVPAWELASDLVDAAIGFFPELLPPGSGLAQTQLTEEKMVALSSMRVKGPLTLKRFAGMPQIKIALTRDIPGMVDEILMKRGYRRRVPLSCSGFLSVPWFLPGTDLLGLVPEKLATAVAAPLKLRVLRLPDEMPPMRLSLLWHQRNTSHPAHLWLRLRLIQSSHSGPARRRRRK